VCIATSQPDLKVFQINPRLYEEYAGNYQLAPDRVISLGPFSEAGGRLVFFDSQTRRFGVLYPLSETQFVTGTLQENGMVTPADLYVTFTRTPTGKVSGLVWQEGSAGSLKGIKVNPHRNEEIVFNNGDVELHGTLTVPATAGPHPAVVLLQEAGPRSRPFGIWPYLFARHGIAMLTFDKRGVGVSTGDWQTASFSDLAGDALAAVRLLRSRSDIDAKHIGLWGNSNSGWLVPLAAVRSKDVAFLITRVGSSLPPTENILFEIENQMREQGFSEEEISKAVALRRQLQSAILTNKGWAEFIAAAKSARNERWFPSSRVARYAAAQLPPDELRLQAWRGPLAFDPIPYWEKVSCPVLAIYGELDKNTPTARNVPPLVAALKRGGNRDYTIIILPKTDHHFYENATESLGYFAEIAAMQRFVPGYVDRMMNWIAQRASD
jgi:dienelactone hydrolase